ncbi:MAG: HAMP domain-containing histidine kinase [Planctomycetes bacterium]|nr:HAMP domain-containing histidine kinase [Planctomycetota bacterium]
MKRQWRIWIAFGLALAVLLAAVGSVTLTALRLDRAEAEARHQAALEENVRLALWRMDSALAPLLAQENARPYFAYSAFYPAERAYTKMFAEIERDEVLLPSPLLAVTSEYVLLHFQFGPDGALTSPQVPEGNMRDLAETSYVTAEKIATAARLLEKLKAKLDRKTLLAALPRRPGTARSAQLVQAEEPGQAPPNSPVQQTMRNIEEYQARSRSYHQAAAQTENVTLRAAKVYPATEAVHRAVWLGERLLLARRVSVDGWEYLQGCWLDWAGIEKWLLADIRDLLPEGRLEPLTAQASDPRARVLASLPVRLVPGALPAEPRPSLSPISLSLIIAWACVLVAGLAVAVLLLGAVSLSERRAAFVSAVTHELRTPLTTFQLYSEMLAEGMVSDDAKREHYLKTLRTEADRLSHLVENVLSYARLERGRARGRVPSIPLRDLIERVRERLARRAEQAGMTLIVEAPDDVLGLAVRADASAVEHILLNLVDNASKYASEAEDKRIHLDAVRSPAFRRFRVWSPAFRQSSILLLIRDHGPGLSADARQRLFQPFSKSARDAAHSRPGVGLGLALSRRLARDMGGDLALDPSVTDGACFALSLPCA